MFEDFGNTPSVLILGAGLMQKPAIDAAKKNGYKTVVADANPNAVAVGFADSFAPVDLKDRDGLLALAKKIPNLKAVFTAGTDFSASVAYVAEAMGLHSHNFESCLNASNKVRMRGCFEKAGVPSPDFRQITAADIALFDSEKIAAMKFPKVVKPADNMGARGCRMIRSAEEFLPALEDAVKNSRSSTAILEDFMDGSEFSIDSIVYNGTLTITGFADRHIYFPPYFIETGHSMPSQISEKMRLELIATFARGVAALGLTEGAAKGDIKYTKNGAMIGEIAARLSGGYMSGWTYPYASGVNLTEQALLIAAGKEPEALLKNRVKLDLGENCPFELFDFPCQKASTERAWISIPGVIKEISGLDEAKSLPNIRDVLPRNKAGDTVDFPRNNVQKCGNVISVAPTFEQAQNAAHEAIRHITLRLSPNCPETEAFLAGNTRADESGFPPCAYPELSRLDWQKGLSETISENESVIEKCPPILLQSDEKDWNHCTFQQTLERFERLCPAHSALDCKRFFAAAIRGGIQGALYVADTENERGKI